MSPSRAEEILKSLAACDGLFLVRTNEAPDDNPVISFYFRGNIIHYSLKRTRGGFVNNEDVVYPDLR